MNDTDFAECIETLTRIAKDPQSDPKDVERAEECLRALSSNEKLERARRNSAAAAVKAIEEKNHLASRMGVSTRATKPRREGVHHVFPTMTPAEARAFASRKAGG